MVGVLKADDWPWPESDTRWLETWASKSKHHVSVFARGLAKVYGRQAGRQLTIQELCSALDPKLAKAVRKPKRFEDGGMKITALDILREAGMDLTPKEFEQMIREGEANERARDAARREAGGEDVIPE